MINSFYPATSIPYIPGLLSRTPWNQSYRHCLTHDALKSNSLCLCLSLLSFCLVLISCNSLLAGFHQNLICTLFLTPSLPLPVKIPGWKTHGRAGRQCIFRSYSTSTFSAVKGLMLFVHLPFPMSGHVSPMLRSLCTGFLSSTVFSTNC